MTDTRLYPSVRERVLDAVERLIDASALRELASQLLSRPGMCLSPSWHRRWSALVILPCLALDGDGQAATFGAAAVEIAATAGDVADDLADGDWASGDRDWPRALNATTALLSLACRCLANLGEPLGWARAEQATSMLAEGTIAACGGQDLDLQFEWQGDVSEEQAYEATRRKAGSLAACACGIGALCATEDAETISLVARFGSKVGIIAQLLNDITGLADGSDLGKRKQTVPIAYALRCAREEGLADLLSWYASDRPRQEQADVARRMEALGALHYGWVLAEAHRREALACLRRLARHSGRGQVSSLRRLLPDLKPVRPGDGRRGPG
ncbi:MAG: polyprenyl synthetase family protein [Chloroflexi bacterium]|nr:polyprenyl synthetase family protein [Chloroflexota bacterium]MCL5111239.1 polyprenyl synthetase family protein [Chloroflexota bacterium]